MSESKECHLNNDSILTNCLSIFDQVERTEKKCSKSSYADALRKVGQLKDKALLAAELDDFAHCKDIH